MNNRTQKNAFIGLATAFAMVLSYIEMILPPIYSAVPGIKVGLPNIVIIFLIYKLSFKEAALVSLVRIFLSALLFGTAVSLIYSLSGAVSSLLVMVVLKKTNMFSILGVSISGAVFHNLGQILAAIIVMQTIEIGYYMIVLSISGIIAGVFVGIAGSMCLKYSKNIKMQ